MEALSQDQKVIADQVYQGSAGLRALQAQRRASRGPEPKEEVKTPG